MIAQSISPVKVHPFYRENNLRVHEIPTGRKGPLAAGWPDSQRPYDEVDSALAGSGFNKYGWLLDDCHLVIDIDCHAGGANGYESFARLQDDLGLSLIEACGAIVQTPSGGAHLYFSRPAEGSFGKVFSRHYPGIDFIAGKGKQVIAVGSCHDSHAGQYRFVQTLEGIE